MTNPAFTLRSHFNHLVGINRSEKSWPQAWEMVTGLSWTVAVGPLLGLVDQTHDLLSGDPQIESEPLLRMEPSWRHTILLPGVQHGPSMNDSGYAIDPNSIDALYAAGVAIQAHLANQAIASEEIERLKAATSELQQAVLEAEDLSDELRTFLLQHIVAMQTRLARRQATGDGPIVSLISESVGTAAVHPTLWQQAMGSSVRTKLLAVYIAFNAVVSGFNNTWDATGTAIGHGHDAYALTQEVLDHVLADPSSRAIEAPKQNELPAAQPPGQQLPPEVIEPR